MNFRKANPAAKNLEAGIIHYGWKLHKITHMEFEDACQDLWEAVVRATNRSRKPLPLSHLIAVVYFAHLKIMDELQRQRNLEMKMRTIRSRKVSFEDLRATMNKEEIERERGNPVEREVFRTLNRERARRIIQEAIVKFNDDQQKAIAKRINGASFEVCGMAGGFSKQRAEQVFKKFKIELIKVLESRSISTRRF